MSSLFGQLAGLMGGDTLKQISGQVGTDETKTRAVVSAALPMLLGALSKNADDPKGAEALHGALARDHDGGILGQVSGFLNAGDSGPGAGILRHVLGGRQPAVESSLARSSGLDRGSIGKILTTLAPLVMGALGKTQREQGIDASGLAGLLGRERQELEREQPQAMGTLGKLLDSDGDGDLDLGDLARRGSGLLGKFLGR